MRKTINIITKLKKQGLIEFLYSKAGLTIVCIGLIINSVSAQLVHPGGWHTQAELTEIRENVNAGVEPWITGWNAARNNGPNANFTTNPSTLITSNGAMHTAGMSAWVLTMKWVASGDKAYSDAAIAIIDKWVEVVRDFDVYGPTLTLSTGAGAMAQAAEILEHGFNGEAGWSQPDADAAKVWFKEIVYDPWTNTGGFRSTNWGTSALGGNMSMAIFMNDIDEYNYQVEAYKFGYQDTDDGCTALTDYIFDASGQAQETGRDQAHVQGGIAHLTEAALCMWNQGNTEIVYRENNRLLAGVEYHARYNLGYDDLPFTTDVYNPCDLPLISRWSDAISEDYRGEFSPVYYMSAKLFSKAGLDHPNTIEVLTYPGYSPEINNFAHPGLGMFCFVSAPVDLCNNTGSLVQAECFDEMQGINHEGASIGSIRDGAWTKYEGIDLTGVNSINVLASSAGVGGKVEFRLDALDGELIGTVDLAVTGGWGDWQTFSGNIPRVTGVHDVYTVFKGENGWLYNIDLFSFSEDVVCATTPIHIEAECFDAMSGIDTENCSEGTLNLGYIENDDWILFNNIDLTGMKSIKARVSGRTTGSEIEVRLDSEDGQLIGVLPVTNTGGWQSWETVHINIQEISGTQNVYLVFKGTDGYLFNINSFGFSEEAIVVTSVESGSDRHQINIFPNPAKNQITISKAEGSTYEIYDQSGVLYLNGEITKEDQSIFTNELLSGIYFMKLTDQGYSTVKKVFIH